jgi:hypothetical protein
MSAVALPGSHFTAALAFLLLGSLALVRVAPLLAAGAYATAPVVATAHLFTLGWISTTIMGALYQLLPVALGREIRWRAMAWSCGTLQVLGLVTFVGGLFTGTSALTAIGGAALGLALAGFALNLAATLIQSAKRDLTWWALAAAAFFLLITVVLGVALATNLRWGFLGAAQGIAVATHATVALSGWVLLVVLGVSHRLLPMFLLSHGANEWFARIAAASLTAGAGTLAFGHHAVLLRQWVAPALLAVGTGAFVLQTREFFSRRFRRGLDVGLRLAAAALGMLSVALGIGIASRLTTPALAPLALQATILAIVVYVSALYYKIIPFLVWNTYFGPLVGTRDLPRVADLYLQRSASAAAVLLFGGATVILVGVALHATSATTIGTIGFAAGAVIMTGQMFAISRRRP